MTIYHTKTLKEMKRILLPVILILTAVVLRAQDEPTQTFNRNLLVEEFTTVNSGWNPPAVDRITEAIGSQSNVIWIKHHAGFGTDFLTNYIHTAMTAFYGGGTFTPAMMVDRTRFNYEDDGPVSSVGQVDDIRDVFTRARQVVSYCKVYPVEVSFNTATRALTGSVSGRFGEPDRWDGNTRITIYIIEDSIVGEQHDYTDHGNWTDYVHMGTVRAAITDMWGETLGVNSDDRTFNYSFSYTLPDNYVYQHCKVVAFVSQYDATDINNCSVLNAAQSGYLEGDPVGIGECAMANIQLSVFPNPASGSVALEADGEIETLTIVNTLGQKVFEKSHCGRQQLSVNTEGFPRGLYLVTVNTAKGTASRKLVVR